eukprot:scaffold5703_cov132-Cylindrotheca_fusiformis.AAC.9
MPIRMSFFRAKKAKSSERTMADNYFLPDDDDDGDLDNGTFQTTEMTNGTGSAVVEGEDEDFSSSFSLRSRKSDTFSGEIGQKNSAISMKGSRTSRASLKENANLQELTINKLYFDDIGLVGREREVESLLSCFSRMNRKKDGKYWKELVFVKGYSGSGKSMLTTMLEKPLAPFENGVMVRGKFDLNQRDEPYAAIAEAFGQICLQIQDNGDGERKAVGSFSQIGKEIKAELGTEVGLLASLIPELASLIPAERRTSRIINESFNFEAGQERWRYVFRVLTRILCSHFSPLVLVLEDLQWSDPASLETIEYLLSDTLNTNPLMIVGTYRSNEVDEEHILSKSIQNLSKRQRKYEYNITDIELFPFELEDVNSVLMKMLRIDNKETTMGLAEICLKRTLGNPFFLIEFVTMLEEEEMLSFNLGMLKWVWDKKEIENATMTTANVVDLLDAKMKKLPDDVQLLAQCAACLGATFKLSTINLIWTEYLTENSKPETAKVSSLLSVLEEGNFIESCGPREYRWVHDKIQEAALSFGDASEASFQFEIGSVLYTSLDEEGLYDILFDVVNLINRGEQEGRPDYALLNLKAAEKARSLAAFSSAANYVMQGIRLLPSDRWISYRDLTLRFHVIGAEMELAMGRVRLMNQYINTVLSRDDCSITEKLPLHLSRVYKLCTVDLKYDETIDYCLAVLKQLDCRMVFSNTLLPAQASLSLMRTVNSAKKLSKDDYKALKPMSDPTDQVALLLQERVSSKYTEAITLFNSHTSCLAWTMPIATCLQPISAAYEAGMQSGNTEQAMWALQECPNIAYRTEDVKQHEQSIFLSMFWQMMLNLTGQSEETIKLKGSVFDCDTFKCKTDLEDALFHLAKLELMVFFGNFEAAAELALDRGDTYERKAPGYFLGMMETFHRGLALYVVAQKTNKRRYSVAAKKILKTITKWAEDGNPNVKHFQSLLMAEQAWLDKQYREAEKLYRDSIAMSARTGHLHHAGLFYERYSDFLTEARNDLEGASYRRMEATRFYREWGAFGVVNRL